MSIESERLEHDENLADYIDFAGYGAKRMEHEQGMFAGRRCVAYQGGISLVELMAGDQGELIGPQMKMV